MHDRRDRCAFCSHEVDPGDAFCSACGAPLAAHGLPARDYSHWVLDALPGGLFITNARGCVRFWNQAMERMTEIPRREMLGRSLFERLVHLQPFEAQFRRVLESGVPLRIESLPHEAGSRGEVTESYVITPLVSDAGQVGILGIVEDITQKLRVDTQLIRSERLAAVGELASGIAHNFNNILASIGGEAQLLKMMADEDGVPIYVAASAETIYQETMRGGRIAHDLLNFARGAEPKLEPLDCRTLIHDTIRLISNHPASKHVEVELAVPEELPRVEADANQLHQVFFNLALNGMQAMPKGGLLTITAQVRSSEADTDVAMLDVKFNDTGVGIPEKRLRRIFDPFFSRRPDGSVGSGLGLTVSLAMVRSIGGDLQISSVEGIGTTVTVSLPVVERRVAPRNTSRRGREHGRVLVVDDEANIRRTLATLLARRGFDVASAVDGEEAVSRFEEARNGRPFDVVLMDLMLPRLDGVQAISMIRDQDPEVPVIVLTGVTVQDKVRQALEAGARFSFSKPVNFAELLAVVERLASQPDLVEA